MFGLGAFFLRLFASGWLKRLGAALSYLFVHPMFAIALLAGMYGAWEHHDAAKWHRRADSETGAARVERSNRLADGRTWAASDATNHASIDLLLATVNSQSAAVARWAKVANGRQAAAAASLARETVRDRSIVAEKARIDAERGSGCRTGSAVMAAKGDL
jgi:hypothetical protein